MAKDTFWRPTSKGIVIRLIGPKRKTKASKRPRSMPKPFNKRVGGNNKRIEATNDSVPRCSAPATPAKATINMSGIKYLKGRSAALAKAGYRERSQSPTPVGRRVSKAISLTVLQKGRVIWASCFMKYPKEASTNQGMVATHNKELIVVRHMDRATLALSKWLIRPADAPPGQEATIMRPAA